MLDLVSHSLLPTPLPWRASASNEPDRVVVINDVSAVRGGATSVALSSAVLLQERGIPLTYITGDDASALDPSLNATDVVAVGGQHILQASPLRAMRDGIYNRRAEQALAGWIAAHDTPRTVYHLHGWSKILSPSVFRALRPVAARLVVNAHDFFLVCPNGGYFDFQRGRPCALEPMGRSCLLSSCDRRNYAHKLWRSVRQAVRRTLCDLATDVAAVVAVHDGMLPLLERGGIPRSRLRALRNPVVPWSRTRIAAERNRLFVFVGRLEQDKGVDLLVAAARDADVAVRIIGDGPLAPRIAADYPEVECVGWKSRDEIPAWIKDARALVMPSRYREPFGLVAFEALTSGLPVVISDYAMIAEELVASGLGFACDPHDRAALGTILSRLASDDALVESMSRRAHAEAHQFALTPAAWSSQLLSIYADVLHTGVSV